MYEWDRGPPAAIPESFRCWCGGVVPLISTRHCLQCGQRICMQCWHHDCASCRARTARDGQQGRSTPYG